MSRLVFFVSSMDGGGAERVAALLCNYWADQGHEVVLVPTFSGRGKCVYPLSGGVRLEYLADRMGTTRRSILTMVRRLLAMRAVVRETRPDAVLSFLTHVNVATILATRLAVGRVVVSERAFPPAVRTGKVWSALRRWTYPMASRVVMQTHGGQQWQERSIPGARSAVIPNPCIYPVADSGGRLDPERQVDPGRRVLLAVGRLDEQKRYDDLIDLFAGLAPRFPDWTLVILGEGAQREALEERVRRRAIGDAVALPGRVGNLAEWYERADLYVMSSWFEGFPNSLMEAMAHGVPVVSMDCPTGPSELIRDGVDGILVPSHEGMDGLGRALAEMMTDRARRERFGSEAVSVRDRFSVERIGRLWDEVLEMGR